jgi:hypothetical protein
MSDGDKLIRKRLVRRRAATFRLLITEDDDQRIVTLYERVRKLNGQLDIDVLEDMARRDSENVRLLNQKLRRAQTLLKESADGRTSNSPVS